MYFDFFVKIPKDTGRITLNKRQSATYVEYTYDRVYNPEKKYYIPKRTTIGKQSEIDPTMMLPNPNFLKFFPEFKIQEQRLRDERSSCLRAGSFFVIRKIIKNYKLQEMLIDAMGKDSGLFLDLAVYSVISENNEAQSYSDYTYNHPLLTDEMRIYHDTKIAEFLRMPTAGQRAAFLKAWNAERDYWERICISFDSANKSSQAGETEPTAAKASTDDTADCRSRYSVAYDAFNREPLFYTEYEGDAVGEKQISLMAETAKNYGYRNVGFILDRGNFTEEAIRFMDKSGYDYMIVTKGSRDFVKEWVAEARESFEQSEVKLIWEYQVSSVTLRKNLFPDDKKQKYVHIYGSEDYQDEEACPVIITSRNLSAGEALFLYRNRDESEKLFGEDMSYLAAPSVKLTAAEISETNMLIKFAALIIRSKLYSSLINGMEKAENHPNYLTVSAAIRELEKIEVIRQPDRSYWLDQALTKTQKRILRAFGLDSNYIEKEIQKLFD